MVSVVTGTHADDLAELFVQVLWVGNANAGTDFMDGLRGGCSQRWRRNYRLEYDPDQR